MLSKSLKKCFKHWTLLKKQASFGISSPFRGGLSNLENCIISSTLENRLVCKGFSPFEEHLIAVDSQLWPPYLDPRESGGLKSLPRIVSRR